MRIVTIGMFVGALALGHGFAEAAPPALAAPLTLAEVLRLVEERSPALRAAAARAEGAEGLREQAGAFPNPELALEAENFGGAGEAREFDAAETTLRLTQEVEIGKRGPRMLEARAASSIAALGAGAVRLDLRREAAVRFAELLAAEERALLAREGAET
ncbi:MAG: TolC family protein, partial [Candidatus Latescibacterota bacterium]